MRSALAAPWHIMSFRCVWGEGSLAIHGHCYTHLVFLFQLKNSIEIYIAMAERGRDFGYKDPGLDYNLDYDGDDNDDKQEVNTTQAFQPGVASTLYQCGVPYHDDKQMEMDTMQHEQSRPPGTSYQEDTPLLRPQGSLRKLKEDSKI